MSSNTRKGVSSRLLTMKFMQRAAASTDPNSDNSCSKKRKANGSSVQGRLDVNIDQALIQAAIDQQEATRQAALKEHSLVDTQWTMNNTLRQKSWNEAEEKPLDIVYVGYCDIDSANQMDNNMEAPATGLTSTKNTKQGDHQGSNKKRKFSDDDDDSGQTCSESLGESEACDGKRRKRNSTGGSNSLTPHSSPSLFVTNPSEESKAKEFGEKRSKKKMGFKQVTSISARGQSAQDARGAPKLAGLTCYTCQQVGHRASDCPKRGSRRWSQKS